VTETVRGHSTIRGLVEIARVDHWFKNVFVLPGVVVAMGFAPVPANASAIGAFLMRLVVGLVTVCLVASSNYVLNEILDAPFDRHHPEKSRRAVPSGRVNVRLAYLEWLVLAAIGIGLGARLSRGLGVALAALWIMGCVYNIPPIRSKDIPYVDVLSEAVNNPLRMLVGWYIVNPGGLAPVSLLVSYWMVGCYFMAIKRFAEYRHLGDRSRAIAYRRSFAGVTEERLLISIVFYASAAMLFFGAFAMRYRIELIVSFPLIAFVMAIYLAVGFRPDSAAQRPEGLYREPLLMAAVVACTILVAVLLFVDLPSVSRVFVPTLPGARNAAVRPAISHNVLP
jgi:decaprenyl-phosphate phosphoribosyltransferase